MPRPRATREIYPQFRTLTTRWRDNDVFGHINNVVYLEYVDTCVNAWLLENGMDVLNGPVIGLVVENSCTYHASLTFPEPIDTGIRVSRIGTTSVTYEVGLFALGEKEAAAEALFTHVYVSRETGKPEPLVKSHREMLETILAI